MFTTLIFKKNYTIINKYFIRFAGSLYKYLVRVLWTRKLIKLIVNKSGLSFAIKIKVEVQHLSSIYIHRLSHISETAIIVVFTPDNDGATYEILISYQHLLNDLFILESEPSMSRRCTVVDLATVVIYL